MENKILSVVLILILLISCVTVSANESRATEENVYRIGTLEELVAFRDKVNGGETTACAQLTANIEVGQWTPIGTVENKYAGTFDGKGFTIKGINGSGTQWGFFKYTNGGVIKNLTIEAGNNGTINVAHQSALFVAIAENNTRITRCAGYGNISIADGYVGGITCQGACIVTDCYYVGNITGAHWVTGMGFNAVATNCFVYGKIKGTATAFKVANGSGTSHAANFYISAEAPTLAGYGTQKSADAFASGEVAYLLGEAYGQTLGTDKHPVFRTTKNVVEKNGDSYINKPEEPPVENPDEEPEILEGDGSAENPYKITSFGTLKMFRDKVNSGEASACARLEANVKTEGKWTPIATESNKYTGIFDGNGFEITNLSGSGATWGFISHTDGGVIKNLTLRTAEEGTGDLGHESALFVAKASNNTEITNCAGYGKVYSSWAHVGGITYKGACNVTNCYFVGTVEGVHDITGMGYDSVATNCFVYGTVKARTSAFKITNKTSINSYFLNVEGVNKVGYGTQKTEDAFKSGEVAYLLGEAYGQILGKEEHPVFANSYNKVEQGSKGYVNKYATPEINKIRFVREDGMVFEDENFVSAYTEKIVICFNSKMLQETIEEAVSLTDINGNPVEGANGELSQDGTEYIISLEKRFEGEKYILRVDKSVQNIIENTLKEDAVININIADTDVAIITKAEMPQGLSLNDIKSGSAFEIAVSGYNPNNKEQRISVILAGYKTINGAKKMVASSFKSLVIEEGSGVKLSEKVKLVPVGFDGADEVKLFVWNYPLQVKLVPVINIK